MATGTIVAFHRDKPICFLEDDQLKKKVLILKAKGLKIGDRVNYHRISSPTGLIGICVKKQ